MAPVEGLYDIGAWRELWRQALATPVATAAGPGVEATGVCPYRGLSAFRAEDSGWFFGQDRSTKALVSRLTGTVGTGGIVALIGASGAGKSSLMHAGLLPALGRGALPAEWPVIVITPGDDPAADQTLVEKLRHRWSLPTALAFRASI